MGINVRTSSLRASAGPGGPESEGMRMYVSRTEFARLARIIGCDSDQEWLEAEWLLGHGFDPERIFIRVGGLDEATASH